jgi:hypothetical protein
MNTKFPAEVEVYGLYSQHLGPRYEGAGLRLQFHWNQEPGVHFKVVPPKEYEEAILKGIKEGLAARFPHMPTTASIWITEITAHEVDSSQRAFYRAGRMAIDQAYSLMDSQG